MTVRLLDELNDLEKLSLIDLSYSRIETVHGDFGCEAKYFYSYIVREDRQFGAAATLGNIVHTTLENVLQPDEKFTYEQLEQEFTKQVPEWDPEGKIEPVLIDAGKEMLAEFVDRHKHDTFRIESKEMKFSIVVGTGLFNGYIDRVDIKGDRITITDYKTGKKEVAQKHIPNNLQLGIYALAVDKIYPGKEVYAQLYYLRSGRQKGHLFTRDDLEVVEERLLNIANEFIERRDFHTTANERLCSYCDFNNGVCPVGTWRAAKFRR